MDVYSDAHLVSFAVYNYETALSIYRSLAQEWFPALMPTLGLAAMLPVSLTGTVAEEAVSGSGVGQ